MHFGETKTYRRRTIAIPAFLRDLLATHLDDRPDDPDALVFTNTRGGPLRHSSFRRWMWLPAVVASRLPQGFRIHDLRHHVPPS